MVSHVSKDKEKLCNICGESVKTFIIFENAPLCKDCMPMKELKKIQKIPSVNTMLSRILEGEKI